MPLAIPIALTALAAIELARLCHAIRHRHRPTPADILGDLYP